MKSESNQKYSGTSQGESEQLQEGIVLQDKTNEKKVPLCVDLDGTLVRTDLLVESWFALLKLCLHSCFRFGFLLARHDSNTRLRFVLI